MRKVSPNLRYCRPDDAPVRPNGAAATFYVLGPPLKPELLRKINPSTRDKETFGLALDGFQMFLDGVGTALASADNGRHSTAAVRNPVRICNRDAVFPAALLDGE